MAPPTSDSTPDFFVAGGTLRADAPSYVPRREDAYLHTALSAGEFAYVLTSRQMGKSSLMVRTAERLREDGVAVVVLDLTAFGQNLEAEQWYAGLLSGVGQRLDLEDELDDFWEANSHLGPLHRWMEALRTVVLPSVDGPIVIFIDEIDVVQSLPFSTGEFFAAIRECYTRRAEDPTLERLTFCLVGVATPAELIDDPLTTPFNIGTRIELRDFQASDARLLAEGLALDTDVAERVVERVLHWTGGHPYLTQRVCQLARQADCDSILAVDALIATEFLSGQAREQEPNLQFVHSSMLRRDIDTAALLGLYRDVLRRKRVDYDETNPLINVLRLSGLVRVDYQRLHVRNDIYARVFDQKWITENMPGAELRRQRAAHRRGMLHAIAGAAVIVAAIGALAMYAHGQRGRAESLLAETTGLLVDLRVERANDRISPDDPARLFDLLDAWRGVEETSNGTTSLASMWAIQHARVAEGLAYAKSTDAATFDTKVSDDGTFAATGYGDGAVHLWMCATGEPLGSVWHDAPVHELNITRGDRYLTVGLTDGSVHVWSLSTYERIGPPLPHPTPITIMRMGSDTALDTWQIDDDRVTLRRWDVETGELLSAPLILPVVGVWSVLGWPNGLLVSVLAADGCGVYDLATGEALWERQFGAGPKVRTWTQTEERLVVAFEGGGLLSVDAEGNVTALPSIPAGATELRFAGDGSMLAIASDHPTGSMQLWDVAAGLPSGDPLVYAGGADWWEFEFVRPQNRVFLESHQDTTSTIAAWDLDTRRQVVSLTVPRAMAERTFVGNEVAMRTSQGGSTVRALRYAPQEHVAVIGRLAPRGGGRLAATQDGRHVALASSARSTVLIGDATMDTLDQFGEVDVGLGTSSVDWHPDGRTLLVAVENELLLVDPATAKVRRRLDVGGRNGAVVYHPSGRLLATSDSTRGRVVFRDAATLEPSGAEVVLPAEVVTDAANIDFSPDGSLLATGQNDGYVRLWNVGTREEAGSPLLHGGMVNGVSFSADGSYIVSTNWSGETAKVWDVAKREQVGETLRHKGVVWSGTFHPGGELLVVESNDRNSTLWHWRTGTDLTAYLEHPAGVGDSAFTPSGRTLYTVTVGSRDQASGGVRRWDFPRIPASLREATLRTSLFTGVERIASDKHVTLTPERWSEYRAELAAIEATDQ